jgi:hypothetical protein
MLLPLVKQKGNNRIKASLFLPVYPSLRGMPEKLRKKNKKQALKHMQS